MYTYIGSSISLTGSQLADFGGNLGDQLLYYPSSPTAGPGHVERVLLVGLGDGLTTPNGRAASKQAIKYLNNNLNDIENIIYLIPSTGESAVDGDGVAEWESDSQTVDAMCRAAILANAPFTKYLNPTSPDNVETASDSNSPKKNKKLNKVKTLSVVLQPLGQDNANVSPIPEKSSSAPSLKESSGKHVASVLNSHAALDSSLDTTRVISQG